MKKSNKRNIKHKSVKKDFNKFSKRNTHKRRDKEAARRALLGAVEKTGVGYSSGLKLGNAVSGAGKRRDRRVRGVFLGSASGYGFVRSEGYGEDIFIPEGAVCGAVDGDLVEAAFHEYRGYNGKRTEGRVVRIIEYGRQFLIGTLVCSAYGVKKPPVLMPDDRSVSLRPYVKDIGGATLGDKVMVRLNRGDGCFALTASVVENYGESESRTANYRAILDDCGVETEFTDEELYEADKVASVPLSSEDRVCRTGDVIFTIDGEGAKDLDDAISLKKTRGGYLLGVHIADVSHYVREKTALDRLAMRRGTSIYFTDKVVPMLPEALSNGACSLNAGEEKYALSAMISVNEEGEIRDLTLEKSIIKSRVRGVYSEVNKLFSGEADADLRNKYREVLPALKRMRELYLILAEKSRKRGAIDMEIPEAAIYLDEGGNPAKIEKTQRGESERLIEQFMLLANEAVATRLHSMGIPCVYRVHERPAPDKLSTFIDFAKGLGLKTSEISQEEAPSVAFSRLLREADENGVLPQVSRTLLRAMSKAKYSEVRQMHFGLGIKNYCHFTSPIRRLSDLATHRIIKKALLEGGEGPRYLSYAKRAAAAATEGELRALSAERRIDALYKTVYMSEHIGEVYSATVSSVTSFGMFCELDNTCEGLVSLSDLGEYYYDEGTLSMRSQSGCIRLGDRVKVRVESCDIIHTRVEFSLVSEVCE